MGRIYGGDVKRVGEALLAKYPELFNKDFENNKEKISAILKTDSKKLINKVAGYITSKVNALNKTKASQEGEIEDPVSGPVQKTDQVGIS